MTTLEDGKDLVVSELFQLFDSARNKIGILDWGVKMTTLEDGKGGRVGERGKRREERKGKREEREEKREERRGEGEKQLCNYIMLISSTPPPPPPHTHTHTHTTC